MSRRLFLSPLLVILTFHLGCPSSSSEFDVDPDAPSNSEAGVGTCNPQITDLEFAKGEWEKIGYYIRVAFTYKTKCNAEISGGAVFIKVTNMDAQDPESNEAQAQYQFDTETSKYVEVNTSLKSIWVDFKIGDSEVSTTYAFAVKLKDSNGYWSNELEEETAYQEISDEVESDSDEGTPTPEPTPEA